MECALFRKDYDKESICSGLNFTALTLWNVPCLERITTYCEGMIVIIIHKDFMECALFRKDYDCSSFFLSKFAKYLYGMCLV